MLNVKVREAYGALGFDLTKYPAELSLDPIRVTAVTREGAQTGAGLVDGFKNEFLPSLGLDPAKLSPEVLSQLAEMVTGVAPQQIEREGEPEESLRPFLYFTINYYGAQDAIKLDCTLTALPGTPAANDLSTETDSSFTYTGSPAAHHFVGKCLEECIHSHEKCRETVSGEVSAEDVEPELPRRVVDVSPPLGEDFVRLIESRGSHGHYATLSHCWGPPTLRPLETTMDTLQERIAGIEMKSLPRSFQDAVRVTRATGVRYLWIDSLCIIQDDDSDKIEQLGQMGAFYERARFTIAAADAANSRQGLFRSLSQEAVPIPYHDQSGRSAGSIFVRCPEPPSRLDDSPLASRAWVTQEMILSRRIVAYTKYGLLWSCLSGHRTEVGEKSPAFSILERSTDWNQIVSLYSAKQLSYKADKLAALEGIATSLKKKTGDSYLAGIWKRDLPTALLWSVKIQDWEAAERLPSTLELPSWSWTSVDCPVHPAIPGMWAMRAYAACGEMAVQQTKGGLQLQVDGLLAPAPELAIEVTEAAAANGSNLGKNSLALGLHRGNALRIGKKRRLVPLNRVEVPEELLDDLQQEPNRLDATLKFCRRENGIAHIIGWCLMDDRREIDSEAFALRLLCKGDYGTGKYNFVLLLKRCEDETETYRRIGMGVIHDLKYGGWFRKAKQRQVCII